MRGRRIGEAIHLGPPKHITAAEEEHLFGDGFDPNDTPMVFEIETTGIEVEARMHSEEERTSATECGTTGSG